MAKNLKIYKFFTIFLYKMIVKKDIISQYDFFKNKGKIQWKMNLPSIKNMRLC